MLWLTFGLAEALQIEVTEGSAPIALLGKLSGPDVQGTPPKAKSVTRPSSAISRGILYEEGETAGAKGAAMSGDVVWEMLRESIGGAPPEPIARATISVPERQATFTITFRRNHDKALPASHLIVVDVVVPINFPGREVSNLPGLIFKNAESERGDALIGASARVSDGKFWIALSATHADLLRNEELITGRDWIDIPMLYGNGRRAILTLEKGVAGTDAISQAVNAWAEEGAN